MVDIRETEIIVEKELLRCLYQYGVRLGEKTKNMWENGQISDSGARIVIMAEEIRNIKPSVPPVTKLFTELGTPEAGTLGNGIIICAGTYTGSRSAVGFNLTNSPAAKGFYAVSTIFSAAAITNGGIAIIANVCSISRAGVLTEALGFAFMKIGELAHVAALHAENKPIPPHLQYIKQRSEKPIRKSRFVNSGNLGFTMPGAKCGDFSFLSETIAKIPYQRIGQFVSISLTVYSYYKIVVTSYRYGQKLAYKFKKARQSKLLLKQASFIVNSFNYG